MKHDKASHYPRGMNLYVPDMTYSADVDVIGYAHMDLGSLPVADADGILSAESIASAGATQEFASTYDASVMGRYGRNVTVVASGAATSKVTVHGTDYLGQPMSEELTLAGASAVAGKKAFKHINSVEYGATAATTINLGWGNVLGLPYATKVLERELVNDGAPAQAGTVVTAVLTDQTATSGDPRGTYAPNGGVVADTNYKILAYTTPGNLHGNRHFAA